MPKMLRNLLVVTCFFAATTGAMAQRYLSEVFSSVQVTPNITYGQNIELLTGSPVLKDLTMDIYEPSGDAQAVRPLIIYLHTGSFLPPVINQNPTGSRFDSAAVEMCKQFARRGYVAAAMSYRLGWDPANSDQDVRTGTLLQAVYRAIQDAKACVRYFYAEAAGANTYRIDTNNIILGGQGTGGYIALAYATLDDPAEISLSKFLSNSTNATYFFTAGQSYVNQAVWGDFDGYGGNAAVNNPNNSVGFSSNISFVFNMGGALGDSSWLEAGDVPMVAFHVTGDPFAPYGDGPVYVPTVPPQFVVDVSGSQTVITKANTIGNNDCFINASFSDPYTTAANQNNNGQDGLFPFVTNPAIQAGPWEWYDSTALVGFAQFIGLPAAAGTQAYQNGLATNPDMSKAKGLAYIDTVQNYLNPRIVYCLGLNTGLTPVEVLGTQVGLYPNPATSDFTVDLRNVDADANYIRVTDLTGRVVADVRTEAKATYTFRGDQFTSGVYLVRIGFANGEAVKKLVIR